MSRIKFLTLAAIALSGPSGLPVVSAEPEPIDPGRFEALREKIKPQSGESRFRQVPWLLSLDEALRRGAKEGKPILIWCGAGGAPHTVC